MLKVNNLTGFGAGAGAGVAFEIDTTTTSTSSTITIPAGSRVSGYLAVLVSHATESETEPATATPSGFTADVAVAGSRFDQFSKGTICHKVLDGTETTLTGMNGGTDDEKHLFVFSGNWTSATAYSIASQVTDAAPTLQTVTAGSGTAPLVIIGAAFGLGGSSGRFNGSTDTWDAESTLTDGEAGYKIYTSAPANFDVGQDDTSTNNVLMSLYLEVA